MSICLTAFHLLLVDISRRACNITQTVIDCEVDNFQMVFTYHVGEIFSSFFLYFIILQYCNTFT